ncbi:hypothetical protein JCM8547_002621 [Rhodosporidiobolus lusitaniae]
MTTELSITGVLPVELHSAAIERLTNYSQGGEAFALDEEVFARAGSSAEVVDALGTSAGQVVRVRALRRRGREAEWTIQVNQRPEPPRTASRALQYGVFDFAIEDGSDPRTLASALGFSTPAFSIFTRGVRFHRGAVFVEVSQLFESPEAPQPLDPSSFSVTASTRFSSATTRAPNAAGVPQQTGGQQVEGATGGGLSAQEVREKALEAVEQVARLLKGLVDLRRVD